jgi:6-pyruvoyltetrahydropterin/6-carboxytetrahydropterin synthase
LKTLLLVSKRHCQFIFLPQASPHSQDKKSDVYLSLIPESRFSFRKENLFKQMQKYTDSLPTVCLILFFSFITRRREKQRTSNQNVIYGQNQTTKNRQVNFPKDKDMQERYEIHVQSGFAAAHFLKGYPGNCANTHGHNWIVDVYVTCRQLNEIGIAVDFRDVKQAISDIVKDFDHHYLNELPVFTEMNPTSENIARLFYRELGKRINSDGVRVSKVKVSESPKAGVFYWEE